MIRKSGRINFSPKTLKTNQYLHYKVIKTTLITTVQRFQFGTQRGMSLVAGTVTLLHENNKGADQPAHPRSLINTIVIRYLDSTYSSLTCSMHIFHFLPSLSSWADCLESYLIKIPEDSLSGDDALIGRSIYI